ncbi:MAG: allantoate amidohydrolase [Usitatibacter sp.]
METASAAAGREIIERVQRLARHSDSPHHYTRTYLTPAHRAAADEIAQWMRDAGMAVRVDAAGSVIGRYDAAVTGAKTLLLGSHFDSVRNGGKFDGVLGILVPVACVAELHRRGERLAHAVEVAAFSDEEGARFQTSFLASRAMVDGSASMAGLLERRDADGVTIGDAMRSAGLDPAEADAHRIDPRSLAAYVELHIEQGPVLLHEGRALGVVTSIAAGLRYLAKVKGEAGHAGTVPMARRHDALPAAAEMIVAIERRCSTGGSLVGTVGVLRVKDGTANVIPGDVEFTVDIRAADGVAHVEAARDAFAECEAIARRRGVAFEAAKTHEVPAAPCAAWLQDLIAASIERTIPGEMARRLPSGAGHDAMVLAKACDVGMMFVRCGAGGVSHNPAETVSAGDAELAFRALLDFLRTFRR